MPFITPCQPRLASTPPIGPTWSHEFKFDGYRVQIHKSGETVIVYSRRGADFTKRAGRAIPESVRRIPCESCILDGEMIAFEDGVPNFHALRQGSGDLGVIVFDLLALDGVGLRGETLGYRRDRLGRLFPIQGPIALSEAFDDPHALLDACERMGLEGIVSKRLDRPYASGPTWDWVKVKSEAWRKANRQRFRLFREADR